MGNVNRVPRGLLSLLDSQTQGQNPDSFGQVIAPVFEMNGWLGVSKGYETTQESDVAVLGVSTGIAPIIVPEGQIWLVRAAGFRLITAIDLGTAWRIQLREQQVLTGAPVILAETIGFTTLTQAGAEVSVNVVFPQPWFMTSGARFFGAAVNQSGTLPVAGATPATYCDFLRLSV